MLPFITNNNKIFNQLSYKKIHNKIFFYYYYKYNKNNTGMTFVYFYLYLFSIVVYFDTWRPQINLYQYYFNKLLYLMPTYWRGVLAGRYQFLMKQIVCLWAQDHIMRQPTHHHYYFFLPKLLCFFVAKPTHC